VSKDRVCLASGDGHVGAPTEIYRDYLERRLHDAFDEFAAEHLQRWSPASAESYVPANFHDKFLGTDGFDPARGSPVTWDAELRLKALDQGGIACETLFPDDQNRNDAPFGSGLVPAKIVAGTAQYPPELVRAGARAYNRWLADFCSADPDRLRGLTLLGTLDDVNWCVEEITRAHETGLRTGIVLPLEYYQPLYHHRRYDMLWDCCVELDLSVAVHIGGGQPTYLGEDPWVERFMSVFEAYFFAQRPLWSMMFGGVLERFSTLRLVFTEMGVDWVVPLLDKLASDFSFTMPMQASRHTDRRVELSLTPAEYWRRQCFVAHSAGQKRSEFEGDEFDRVPNMVWGADVGHGEGIWPVVGFPRPVGVAENFRIDVAELTPISGAVKDLLGGLPGTTLRPYLEQNFFHAYPNIDRRRLDAVVERIGPSTAELGLA
jgi:predicted TIM-barrel fold metal-dependent hydrolase